MLPEPSSPAAYLYNEELVFACSTGAGRGGLAEEKISFSAPGTFVGLRKPSEEASLPSVVCLMFFVSVLQVIVSVVVGCVPVCQCFSLRTAGWLPFQQEKVLPSCLRLWRIRSAPQWLDLDLRSGVNILKGGIIFFPSQNIKIYL